MELNKYLVIVGNIYHRDVSTIVIQKRPNAFEGLGHALEQICFGFLGHVSGC